MEKILRQGYRCNDENILCFIVRLIYHKTLNNGGVRMKAYWIWNHESREGIILENHVDATYAATGKAPTPKVSPTAIVFRDTVLDDDVLTIQTVNMPEVTLQEK